jgi:hypothetical protein
MSVTVGTETVAVTTIERTWRVQIETLRGADPVVQGFREFVKTDANGNVLSQMPSGQTRRQLSAISAATVTADGVTVTFAQLAALVSEAIDTFRTQDLAQASGS